MYKKWEYLKEATTSGTISVLKLNGLGAEGWENYDHEGNVFFFKREVMQKQMTPLEKTLHEIKEHDKAAATKSKKK
jgi:hypothetical protein